MTIFQHSPRKNGFAKRLLGAALGTTTLSVALTFGSSLAIDSAFAVEHNSFSPPQSTAGCVDGNCQPRTRAFGHYMSSWRPWPGRKSLYEGFRDTNQGVATEDEWLLDPRDETRFEPRTRSNRPLDPESAAGGLNELIPSSTDEADPNNPFNQTVPETDLPSTGAAPADNGGAGAGGGFGGFDNGGGGLGFGGDAPPAGNGDTGDAGLEESLLPPTNEATPSGGSSIFDLPESDATPDENIFDLGPTSSYSPSDRKPSINIGPVRFIKNRPSLLSRAQRANKSHIHRVTPVHVAQTQSLSVPDLGVAGLVQDEQGGGSLLTGSFTANDLVSPGGLFKAKPDTETDNAFVDAAVDRVSYEEPVQLPGNEADPVVYEQTGNPLRPRVMKSTPQPLSSAKSPSKGTLVPELDVELLPIPNGKKPSVGVKATEDASTATELVAQIPALESQLGQSNNSTTTEQTSRQDGSRTLVAMNKRSLRDTLRKNPLRR